MVILKRIWEKKPWSFSIVRGVCMYCDKRPRPSVSKNHLNTRMIHGLSSRITVSRLVSSDQVKDLYATYKRFISNQAWADIPVGGIIEIPLAQTGEGIAECELLKWFVQVGDEVEEFQPLCEVQSDKATIEITSRYKGKVFEALYDPGDIVKVGATLLKITVEESHTSAPISDIMNIPVILSSETSDESSDESFVPTNCTVRGILSTPAVRHLAKQYSVNINDIVGTGKDGKVLKEDVLTYVTNKELSEKPSTSSHKSSAGRLLIKEEGSFCKLGEDGWDFEDKTISLRGFQRAMVKSMTLAAKVPHFHYLEEINCDALVELKEAFKSENSDPDVKHTYLPFLIKSLSMSLRKHPLLNSSFLEDSHEVTLKGSHNIGVAMATPCGLVVPNIKKVQSLSILEITKELSRLQKLAVNNKLSSEDISGGTITLSNIGAIGGKFGIPLLNLPEVAIIALGRIQKHPRFADDGSVYPASFVNVNIGADHRVVDGAAVAKFCNEWKLLIEKPELLVLHMR